MKIDLGPVPEAALAELSTAEPDASGAAINYADAYLKAIKKTLDDGRKIVCRRRGLKITLTIGDRKGEALLRRLEHGPDPRNILARALGEAAAGAGAVFAESENRLFLQID